VESAQALDCAVRRPVEGSLDYSERATEQWNGWPAEDAKKILSMLKIQFDKG